MTEFLAFAYFAYLHVKTRSYCKSVSTLGTLYIVQVSQRSECTCTILYCTAFLCFAEMIIIKSAELYKLDNKYAKPIQGTVASGSICVSC